MRICFISRRFFPAISGMSVYAANLLRGLADPALPKPRIVLTLGTPRTERGTL